MTRINVYTGDSGRLRHASDADQADRQNDTAASDFRHEVLFHYDPRVERARCYLQAVASDRSSPEQFIVEFDGDGTFQPWDFRNKVRDELGHIGWRILTDSSANMRVFEAFDDVKPYELEGLIADRLDTLLDVDAPLDFGAESKELSVRFFEYLRRRSDLDRPVAISNGGRVDHLEDDCLVITPSKRYDGVEPIEETVGLTYRSELNERLTAAREAIGDAVGNLVAVEDEERVLSRLATRLNDAGLAEMGLALETEGRRARRDLLSRARRVTFAVMVLPLLVLAKLRLDLTPLLDVLGRDMVVSLSVTVAEISTDTPLVDGSVRVASWQLLLAAGLALAWSAWPLLAGRSLLGFLSGRLPFGDSDDATATDVSDNEVESAVRDLRRGRKMAEKLAVSSGRSKQETFATYLQQHVLDAHDLVARKRRAYRLELVLQVALAVLFAAVAALVVGALAAATYDLVLENWTSFVKASLGLAAIGTLVRVHRFLVGRSVIFR